MKTRGKTVTRRWILLLGILALLSALPVGPAYQACGQGLPPATPPADIPPFAYPAPQDSAHAAGAAPADSTAPSAPAATVQPASAQPESLRLVAQPDTLASTARPDSLAGGATQPLAQLSPPPAGSFIVPPHTAPSAVGVYAGSPSFVGINFVTPADGPLAFRTGFTAFPGVGVLWTPGFEFRFAQERGAYSRDGACIFGNMFVGRTYPGRDRRQLRTDLGLGYRWFLSDVRGTRWIAGAELGGQWQGDSILPQRPCLRFYWLAAGR